jgi:hypothetical protein
MIPFRTDRVRFAVKKFLNQVIQREVSVSQENTWQREAELYFIMQKETPMKKKIFDITGRPVKTYKLGRACQHCGEPIADQERASKTHCTRYKDEFGVIHDCKRKKHQLKHQLHEDVLLDWCALQRENKKRIEDIIKSHGDEVSLEVLDAFNVILHNGIRYYQRSASIVVEFLGYNVIVKPKCKTFKIEKYDKLGIRVDDRQAA